METKRDIAGGGASSLKLVEAFYSCAEVPHPLSKPRVMGISVVCRSCKAAPVEGTLDRGVELRDESVEFLGGHRRRDINVRGQEGVGEYTLLSPVPGACGRHKFKAQLKIIQHGSVVGAIKSRVHPPGGDGGLGITGESHIDARAPVGSLKCRGLTKCFQLEVRVER